MKPSGHFLTPSALSARLELSGTRWRGDKVGHSQSRRLGELHICESNRDSSFIQKYPSQSDAYDIPARNNNSSSTYIKPTSIGTSTNNIRGLGWRSG